MPASTVAGIADCGLRLRTRNPEPGTRNARAPPRAQRGGAPDQAAEPDSGDPSHTQCGFTYAGDCGDFAPSHACKKFSRRGFYVDCHDQPITKGARKFNKVITVFASE